MAILLEHFHYRLPLVDRQKAEREPEVLTRSEAGRRKSLLLIYP